MSYIFSKLIKSKTKTNNPLNYKYKEYILNDYIKFLNLKQYDNNNCKYLYNNKIFMKNHYISYLKNICNK